MFNFDMINYTKKPTRKKSVTKTFKRESLAKNILEAFDSLFAC